MSIVNDVPELSAKTPSLAVNTGVALLSGPLQAGSRKNREFFTEKVLGSRDGLKIFQSLIDCLE